MSSELKKRIGLGLALYVKPNGDDAEWTHLGAVIGGLNGPNPTAEVIDTSLLADRFNSYAKGSIDPGELNFKFLYDPENDTTSTLVDLLYADCSTLALWRVVIPDVCDIGTGAEAIYQEFEGFVTSFNRTGERNGNFEAEVTIKLSGEPGLQ